MVTDRMCIIRYENGTHDTEKKETKNFFLELQFLQCNFATSFYVFAENKPRY